LGDRTWLVLTKPDLSLLCVLVHEKPKIKTKRGRALGLFYSHASCVVVWVAVLQTKRRKDQIASNHAADLDVVVVVPGLQATLWSSDRILVALSPPHACAARSGWHRGRSRRSRPCTRHEDELQRPVNESPRSSAMCLPCVVLGRLAQQVLQAIQGVSEVSKKHVNTEQAWDAFA
jgi:hypothetical protein